MKKLKLTQGYFSLVDDEDYARVSQLKWCILVQGKKRVKYATSRLNGKNIRLHRFILNPPSNMVVDHLNGDGLDNRKENLRICTVSENNRNLPRHREGKLLGVTTQKIGGKTYHISHAWDFEKKKNVYVGLGRTPEEAHEMYKEYVRTGRVWRKHKPVTSLKEPNN